MIGIDTNVIIRYVVQDDPQQSALATDFMEIQVSAVNPGLVNHIVLCELCWVLNGAYGFPKSEIIRVLQGLLTAHEIVIPDSSTVWKAVVDFEQGNADFSDYLIAHVNKSNNCSEIVTFDKKAAKHHLFKLL